MHLHMLRHTDILSTQTCVTCHLCAYSRRCQRGILCRILCALLSILVRCLGLACPGDRVLRKHSSAVLFEARTGVLAAERGRIWSTIPLSQYAQGPCQKLVKVLACLVEVSTLCFQFRHAPKAAARRCNDRQSRRCVWTRHSTRVRCTLYRCVPVVSSNFCSSCQFPTRVCRCSGLLYNRAAMCDQRTIRPTLSI